MLTWLNPFRRPSPRQASVDAAYRAIVTQARSPAFYSRLGVPDTLDGRFEMVALHMHAVLRRLRGDADAAEFAQELHDHMFADMDQNLRELGTGDLAVGKRVKEMASALYGRIAAYDAGIDGGPGGLEAALARNLYRHVEPSAGQLSALADYVRACDRLMAGQEVAVLVRGEIRFPSPAAD